ncbi:replicative DNA helicase, partial [Candidatus Berkelbacteria bacterium]|nr:replicative DNA helicase [Candidatus Berkelbacteria bacterium]
MAEEKGINIPPQNLEAEQAVLGALLLEKDAVIKVADVLISEDFYHPGHALIYAAVLKLFEKRMPVDLVTLTNVLEKDKQLKDVGGASYLASLTSAAPSTANIVSWAEIIRSKSTLRRLIAAASQIMSLGYEEKEDITEILDQAESSLFAVSQRFLREFFVPIKEILKDSFERIDELHKHKGKLRGVPTGFRELDNLLAGLQTSDLIILASRPSMGKSSLAITIASFAAIEHKVPVGIFS